MSRPLTTFLLHSRDVCLQVANLHIDLYTISWKLEFQCIFLGLLDWAQYNIIMNKTVKTTTCKDTATSYKSLIFRQACTIAMESHRLPLKPLYSLHHQWILPTLRRRSWQRTIRPRKPPNPSSAACQGHPVSSGLYWRLWIDQPGVRWWCLSALW